MAAGQGPAAAAVPVQHVPAPALAVAAVAVPDPALRDAPAPKDAPGHVQDLVLHPKTRKSLTKC